MGKGAGQDEIELLIVPAASRWSTPRGVFGGGAGEQRARHFREQMGLPAGLIVMSGHQPGFWHAGIAAKALAAAALAERWGASAVWIIVDQDTVDPRTMRVPVIGEGGRLEESVWRLGGALDAGGPETPTCLRPAMNIGVHRPDPGLAERVAGPTATEGLELMAQGLADAVGSGNSAWELGRAGVDSLWRAAHATKADSHIRLVAATQVGATDLFTEVLERMRSDPAACTGAYNAAAAELNAPGIGPLASDAARAGGGRHELPLWRLDRAAAARVRVWSDTVGTIPRGEIVPRALLLTGLLRGAGCEVFIHGGGGGATGVPGGYDKVTERWMQAWLGWTLAPSVVVSATMRLARGGGVVVTPRDVARAVARARRARFSPGLLGQVGAEEEKQRLLGVLADRRGTAAGRRAAFGALRAVQERASADAAESLRAMDAEAARLHEQMEGDRLASDRTWPFPFHGRARLEALSRAIAGAVVEAARGC